MPTKTLYEFVEFLSLLEDSVLSGESGLSSRDYVILLYHLRQISAVLTQRGRYTSIKESEDENEERVLETGFTLHDSVTTKIYMKLMDLGRYPVLSLDLPRERN